MATANYDLGSWLRLQGNTPISNSKGYSSVSTLFNNILPNIYIAAGLVIFIMIVVGGFMIITNASNADKTKEGGQIITSAIIGLLVVFASYWIIQIVQIVTGIQILNSTI